MNEDKVRYFDCPACGQSFSINVLSSESDWTCPACGQTFVLSESDDRMGMSDEAKSESFETNKVKVSEIENYTSNLEQSDMSSSGQSHRAAPIDIIVIKKGRKTQNRVFKSVLCCFCLLSLACLLYKDSLMGFISKKPIIVASTISPDQEFYNCIAFWSGKLEQSPDLWESASKAVREYEWRRMNADTRQLADLFLENIDQIGALTQDRREILSDKESVVQKARSSGALAGGMSGLQAGAALSGINRSQYSYQNDDGSGALSLLLGLAGAAAEAENRAKEAATKIDEAAAVLTRRQHELAKSFRTVLDDYRRTATFSRFKEGCLYGVQDGRRELVELETLRIDWVDESFLFSPSRREFSEQLNAKAVQSIKDIDCLCRYNIPEILEKVVSKFQTVMEKSIDEMCLEYERRMPDEMIQKRLEETGKHEKIAHSEVRQRIRLAIETQYDFSIAVGTIVCARCPKSRKGTSDFQRKAKELSERKQNGLFSVRLLKH